MRVTIAQPFEPRRRRSGHVRLWLAGALLVLVAISLACCLGAPPLARWLAYLTLSAAAGVGGGIALVAGRCALLRACFSR